jgi:hypothetical protein
VLASGGTEGDLMRLAGWQSREMLGRYAGVDRRRACTRRAPSTLTRRSAMKRQRLAAVFVCGLDHVGKRPEIARLILRGGDFRFTASFRQGFLSVTAREGAPRQQH